MVELVPIIVVVVIAIVVIALAFSIFGKKATTTSKTESAPVSTVVTRATVQFYDVNVQNTYNGPDKVGNVTCDYRSYTTVDSQSLTTNGSQVFALKFNPSSTQCPITIYSVGIDTTGFSLISTYPDLPFTLPPDSNAQLQIDAETPSTNFYGPLTITISYT